MSRNKTRTPLNGGVAVAGYLSESEDAALAEWSQANWVISTEFEDDIPLAGTGIRAGEDSHHLDSVMKKVMYVLDWVEDYASSGDLPNQGEPTTDRIVRLTRELLSSLRKEEQA